MKAISVIDFQKTDLITLPLKLVRYEIEDARTPGLRLAVFPSGIKTFFLLKKVNGRSQRIKIGRFSDITVGLARSEANRLKALVTLGGTPHEEKKAKKNEITFKELYELYHDEYAIKKTKTAIANLRMIKLHAYPTIGTKKLWEISPRMIRKIHAHIGDNNGKSTANRVVEFISTAFNYGRKNDIHTHANPCIGVEKFKKRSRDRFLSRNELQSFFEAIEEEGQDFCDYFKLLLFTGVRKSNLLSAKWADINLELRMWRISEKEAKNDDVNIVQLSETAIEILIRRYEQNQRLLFPSKFVFPGTGEKRHLVDPKKSFNRIKKRMAVGDIRMHDLRRTFASYMAISKISLPVIGKALNHKSHRSTEVYARLLNEPILEAVNIAAAAILENKLIPEFRVNAASLFNSATVSIRFSALV